jgi:hypothetical protein
MTLWTISDKGLIHYNPASAITPRPVVTIAYVLPAIYHSALLPFRLRFCPTQVNLTMSSAAPPMADILATGTGSALMPVWRL